MKTCNLPDCDSPLLAKGMCSLHYSRVWRTGSTEKRERRLVPLEARFWAKVDKNGPDGCWVWTGARAVGYGYISRGGGIGSAIVPAHRIAYELLVGPIPDGLHIDHLCRNRPCVNPDHLEAVTQGENNLRSWAARKEAS
jgi:hypothetical protein